MMKASVLVVLGLALTVAGQGVKSSVSITDFGAVGDGKANDTAAFEKAFASGAKNICVPAGTYLIGPKAMAIPANVTLHGDGRASVLTAAKGTGVIFTPGPGVRIEHLKFEGSVMEPGGPSAGIVFLGSGAHGVTLDGLVFESCNRSCIVTDHADDAVIQNSEFRKVAWAVSLQFSDQVKILNNTVVEASGHGIQFWGQFKWNMDGDDLIITGNTVVITDGKSGRRDGIWLTGTNTAQMPSDTGHENVAITGNTIMTEGPKRHGINVGSGKNIVCAGNVLFNADIFDRTGEVKVLGAGAIASAGKETIADVMTAVPLSQEWNFQIDPENKGIKERWFDPAFKPEGWATVRSDRKDGLGWEAQEFGGKDGKGYTGYGWYRAELPKLPDKTRTFAYLYFPMADEQAWVYLNGQVVGEHTEKSEGRTYDAIWDQPFAVDVTKHHKKDGPNLLAVRVHNAALNGGLREPVVLIFSDRPTDTTELVRAVPALTKKK